MTIHFAFGMAKWCSDQGVMWVETLMMVLPGS